MNRYSILVVDDDDATHEVLGSYLEISGYRLRHAGNGAEALQLLHEEVPDLVLLDVQMPELDGFQTLERVRADRRLAETPVLFLTSLDRYNLKVKGLEMGADDYIVKPFNRAEILARIKAALRRCSRFAKANTALSGDVGAITIPELLQTMEIGRRSCCIRFTDLQGSIYLDNGAVAHVSQGSFSGAAALQRILFLEKGRFEVVMGEVPAELPQERLRADYLILDTLTYLDELGTIFGGYDDFGCLVEKVDGPLAGVPESVSALLPMPSKLFLALMEGDLKVNAEQFRQAVTEGRIVVSNSLP